MKVDLERARYLVSDAGRAALAALEPELASLGPVALSTALRKRFPASEASALAEQLTLRAKVAGRLGDHRGNFLLTAAGSEMMTHPLVAERRAARLASAGVPVADVTCGLGGDLGAIAPRASAAIGLERDRATSLLVQHNVPLANVVMGDATRAPFRLERLAVLIDPSRREGGGRTFDPARFSPPFDIALEVAGRAVLGVVKGPPGLDRQHIPLACEFEAVQVGRTLRETTLWFGAGTVPGLRRAVLLPAGSVLGSTGAECEPDPVPIGTVVYDPQSCVTRAHLVRHVAHELGARMLDPQVAYLTSDTAASHPMAEGFEVLDVMPFSVERLRRRLREGGWRPGEIRRRAFPVDPGDLEKLLGKLEGERIVLLCTTLAGKRTVILGRPIRPAADAAVV